MGLFRDNETGCYLHIPGYPLLPKPGELYGQVFIMLNLLPILALNIGVPQHSLSMIFTLLSTLSISTMLGRQWRIARSVYMLKFHWIVEVSFSKTVSTLCCHHRSDLSIHIFDKEPSGYWLAIWLWQLRYLLFAIISHPLMLWVTVSSFFPHCLDLGDSAEW